MPRLPGLVVSYSTGGTTSPALVERARALMWIPQSIVGMFLLLFGLWLGRDHIDLLRGGAIAQGRIVDFKEERWRSSGRSFATTAHLPIVEFPLGGTSVRFVDWLGGRKTEYKNAIVPILYLPDHPSTAMIDRPVWNWVPWGPTAAVGILLLLAALSGFWRFVRRWRY